MSRLRKDRTYQEGVPEPRKSSRQPGANERSEEAFRKHGRVKRAMISMRYSSQWSGSIRSRSGGVFPPEYSQYVSKDDSVSLETPKANWNKEKIQHIKKRDANFYALRHRVNKSSGGTRSTSLYKWILTLAVKIFSNFVLLPCVFSKYHPWKGVASGKGWDDKF